MLFTYIGLRDISSISPYVQNLELISVNNILENYILKKSYTLHTIKVYIVHV